MEYIFYTESQFGLATVQGLSRRIWPVITVLDGTGFSQHGITESRPLFTWLSREGDTAKATLKQMDTRARVRRKPLSFSVLRL